MLRALHHVCICTAALLWTAVAAAGDDVVVLNWQGTARRTVVHVSSHMPASPRSLVVALSGSTQTTQQLRGTLGLDRVAEKEGFVVAYPEPIGGEWSFRPKGGIDVPGKPTDEVDDVGFIAGLVAELTETYRIDRTRIFVVGYSRGALMTWTLLCRHSELFAAAAPLIGAITDAQTADCRPARSIPILAVDGTADPVLPYDGWLNQPPLPRLLSVPETMEFWRRLHGCTRETRVRIEHLHADDPTHTQLFAWTDCARGGEIRLYRIVGGGHRPPEASETPLPEEDGVGRAGRDIDAADAAWAFFKEMTAPKVH